jgi:hypothetical protein
MAKKDDSMMNMLLIAAGAFIVYKFWLEPQMAAAAPQLALPPSDVGATTNGAYVPPPAGNSGSIGQGGMTIQQLEQKMKLAAQGDTNPFNVWRWNFYYNLVTGNPAPDVHLGFAFPGQQVSDIEREVLSFGDWLTKARTYAVNPETNATGGWDPISQFGGGMGFIADRKSGYSRAHGVAGLGEASWGQRGSAQFSNWASGTAGRYRPSRKDIPRVNPRTATGRPLPGKAVLQMPPRVS